MRRLLLTTALVTFAAIPAAHAELEVTLGGYVTFQAGFFNNDDANSSDRDFLSEAEIHVTAKATTESGLTYGAYVEMQGSTNETTNVDEANLFLEGNFGRIELGDQEGAGSALTVLAPYVGIGQVMGSYADFVTDADSGYSVSETAGDPGFKAIDTGDATKATYYTPVFSGFQAGLSYIPEVDDQSDGEEVQFLDNVGNHDNAYEIGLAYNGEFSNVTVALGAQYTGADAKDGSGLEDISAYSVGAQLGYKGFTFGGGYTNDGDSGQTAGAADDDVSSYNLGLTYESGAWGVGVSYLDIDFDDAAVPFDVGGVVGSGGDYTAYGFGGTYKVAPGLSVGADLVFFDRDRVTGADTDGYVAITQVKAAF